MGGYNQNYLDEALQLSEESHHRAADMGLDACYHVLSVISDGRNFDEEPGVGLPYGQGAPDLQDAVFGAPPPGIIDSAFIDQIDGYAVRGDAVGGVDASQYFFQTYMIASDIGDVEFALETTNDQFDDTNFAPYLKIMLSREAHCPGDYDGDGDVDGADQTVFNTDWTNHAKKADLDWDGDWDATDQSIYTVLKNIGCCP